MEMHGAALGALILAIVAAELLFLYGIASTSWSSGSFAFVAVLVLSLGTGMVMTARAWTHRARFP